jgi:phosphotransferase system  glucose/maltose/N-acetylglucosamine-specific IIC component
MKFLYADLFPALVLFGVHVAAYCFFLQEAKGQNSYPSHLGSYGKISTYCGEGPLNQNPPAIPKIGCFLLSPGHRATAEISTHYVEVSVDDADNAVFKADGILITLRNGTPTQTNLPYINNAGSGFAFCSGKTDIMKIPRCPSGITVFSRAADKSILFMVSVCLPPDYNRCVLTQKNLDYEMSRGH